MHPVYSCCFVAYGVINHAPCQLSLPISRLEAALHAVESKAASRNTFGTSRSDLSALIGRRTSTLTNSRQPSVIDTSVDSMAAPIAVAVAGVTANDAPIQEL